jgi:H+/Cl- antiporter ClcA
MTASTPALPRDAAAPAPAGESPAAHSPARALLPLVLPALVVGALSSVLLIVVSAVAAWLQGLLWTGLPQALGADGNARWWIVLILTLSGVAVGLVVWLVPGHAGPDPATTGLVEAPLPPRVLPGLLLALVLMLAGGVSLGPENPIMAVNTGLVFALGSRLLPAVGAPAWVGLASAGMLGAMFGTPVGAALVLSESPGGEGQAPLWDRLFAPLVAAGAGALTTDLLGGPTFSLSVEPYPGPQLIHLVHAPVVAAVAALIGLGAVYAFPHAHRLFHRLPHPLLMVTLGGLLLGLLGALGGPITLFKGLDEMKELAADAAASAASGLALVAVVKLVALVVAGTCGFRGGRIFPAVFVGVALGLCASTLVPAIPVALAVPSAVLGILLAVTRQGWLSLFMAAIVVPDLQLLPILCIASLPAWLLVTGRPPMLIPKPRGESRGEGVAAGRA